VCFQKQIVLYFVTNLSGSNNIAFYIAIAAKLFMLIYFANIPR